MDIGAAVEALWDGRRVRRAGWNGKGMWLALMKATVVPDGQVNTRTRAHIPEGELCVDAYVAMFTAQGTWQPGWVCSQADLLADDWETVD